MAGAGLEISGRRNGVERVAYVLKYGVLQFGLGMGVITFLYAAYEANTWTEPREFVHRLALWMAFGVIFGIAQLRRDEHRKLRRPERSYRGAD